MNKNIDEILQLTTEEFVIKGCTEGLKTRDYFEIKNTLLKYEEYEDNKYYKNTYCAMEAYNKNLNQIYAVKNNITPGISPVSYPKEKIYTKAYLDTSYLE